MRREHGTKILLVSCIVIALLISSISLVACNTTTKTTSAKRPADVFAFAGVSTGALLDSMPRSNTAMAMAGEDTKTEDNSDIVIDELNKYMSLVDSLISSTPSESKTTASDRAEYKTMQVMNIPALDGTWTEYRLYYNEADKKADNSKIASSDDEKDAEDVDKEEDKKDDKKDDKDDEGKEAHIVGIMVIGENEYPIKGDIETEADEQEIEFVAYLNEAKTDYIVMEQERENRESEYEYSIYKDSKLESKFELEIETKDSKQEVELETKDSNGEVIKYQVEKSTEDGKIKVEYTKGGVKGEFDVEATKDANGKDIYKYTLKDKEIDRDRD